MDYLWWCTETELLEQKSQWLQGQQGQGNFQKHITQTSEKIYMYKPMYDTDSWTGIKPDNLVIVFILNLFLTTTATYLLLFWLDKSARIDNFGKWTHPSADRLGI